MDIKHIEVIPLDMDLERVFKGRTYEVTSRPTIVTRVHLTDGTAGEDAIEAISAEVSALRDGGIGGIKVKVGQASLEEDFARARHRPERGCHRAIPGGLMTAGMNPTQLSPWPGQWY